ncbi:hypothetical protein Tco_0167474 [Tanacetum coccineum]
MSNSNTNLQTQSSNALHNAIMEAGSKDRPPMLAPGNYVQWKSRIKRYIDTKPNRELIHYSLQNPPYIYQWAEKTVPVAEGSSETTTERYMENYKNVSQDIRDQMNAEAEAVQIILTGIDNDIYSTVDACPNACEMWKAIERLKQGESINVQDLETKFILEFGKFHNHEMVNHLNRITHGSFYRGMMNELVQNQCNGLTKSSKMNESMIKNEKHIILHGTTFQEVTPDPVDNSGPSLMIARIREVWKMIKLHQFLVKENQYQGSYYYQNGLLRRRLNINLFSVGSNFVMADLEVAFRKSTCYIRDLKGNDLLTGSPWHRIVFQFSCKSHLLPIHLLKAKSNIVYNMVNGIVVYLIKLRHHQLLSKNNIVNGPFQN